MIVVVGAGITGLALAHELESRGAEYIVLEASERPGGVIRSIRNGARVLESGPQRTRLTPAVRALVHELGLDSELLTADAGLPLFVFSRGRLRRVPYSPFGALTSGLLSPLGKLRILAEPLFAPAEATETVAEYLSRAFGPEAYVHLLGPFFGGLYGSDPADMPARHSLLPLLEDLGISGESLLLAALRRSRSSRSQAPACSFRSGLHALPRELYRMHSGRIHLQAPVRNVRRAGSSLVVETDDERWTPKHLILTVPAEEAARLLRRVLPAAAAALASLRYNPLAMAFLESEAPLSGLGYQVALDESLETRGVTFNASLFGPTARDSAGTPTHSANGREGVYTAFLGGSRNPGLVEMPDDWIAEVACNEFRAATRTEARALRVGRVRMPAWDRSWDALESLDLPADIHLATNYTARVGITGRLAQAARLADRLTA